jgi:hypothetical protein
MRISDVCYKKFVRLITLQVAAAVGSLMVCGVRPLGYLHLHPKEALCLLNRPACVPWMMNW